MDSQIITPKYLPLCITEDIDVEIISLIVKRILNYLFNKKLSASEWKKLRQFDCTVVNSNGVPENYHFSFKDICLPLKQNRKFNRAVFKFPQFFCYWIDNEMTLSTNIYCPTGNGEESISFVFNTSLGNDFPIKPCIDREGAAFASMQYTILTEILRSRHYLVEHSDELLQPGGVWLSTLISYFNSCVSIVEITLIQLYYKAKYDGPSKNWVFDEERLGSTICRKFEDKLHWIGQITGKPLDDAKDEMESFNVVKNIRNHLNHFDPPLFAYTIEDVASWLSLVNDIGMLLFKIRSKMDICINDQIVELMLLPKVNFVPNHPDTIRYPQKPNVGYQSCHFIHR